MVNDDIVIMPKTFIIVPKKVFNGEKIFQPSIVYTTKVIINTEIGSTNINFIVISLNLLEFEHYKKWNGGNSIVFLY